jgi:hypothetical protein
MQHSRRTFLAIAGLAPAVLLAPGAVRAAEAAACPADPASLPATQRNRRRSIGYVEASDNSTRRCGLCSFFTASADGCGKCQLLGGGPVSAGGVCGSFAAKAS